MLLSNCPQLQGDLGRKNPVLVRITRGGGEADGLRVRRGQRSGEQGSQTPGIRWPVGRRLPQDPEGDVPVGQLGPHPVHGEAAPVQNSHVLPFDSLPVERFGIFQAADVHIQEVALHRHQPGSLPHQPVLPRAVFRHPWHAKLACQGGCQAVQPGVVPMGASQRVNVGTVDLEQVLEPGRVPFRMDGLVRVAGDHQEALGAHHAVQKGQLPSGRLLALVQHDVPEATRVPSDLQVTVPFEGLKGQYRKVVQVEAVGPAFLVGVHLHNIPPKPLPG